MPEERKRKAREGEIGAQKREFDKEYMNKKISEWTKRGRIRELNWKKKT